MSDRKEKYLHLKEWVSSIFSAIKNKLFNGCCFIKKSSAALFSCYKSLVMHLKVAIAAGVGVILLIIIVVIFSDYHHKSILPIVSNKTPLKETNLVAKPVLTPSITSGVNDNLTDLQAKLANIEKMLSSRRSVVNIDKVRTDIHSLNQEITQIEQDNKAQYSALHSQITSLSLRLGSYQKITTNKLDEIEAVHKKMKCLSGSYLPFVVQSIDMVNGRNVVSVLYANMVSPLENNFTLAGWKLTSSDYEHQTARFMNRKKVCASVNLNGNF